MTKDFNKLIEKARDGLIRLTGLKASSVVKIDKNDSGWLISIEMVEKESNPHKAIIVENAELRHFVRNLTEIEFFDIPVLSRMELLPELEKNIIGEIELELQ